MMAGGACKRTVRTVRTIAVIAVSTLVAALLTDAGARGQSPTGSAGSVPEDEVIRRFDRILVSNPGGEEWWECNIVEENDEKVTIEKINEEGNVAGMFTLPRSRLKEIEHRRTADDVFETKQKRLPGPRSDPKRRARALLDLGIWCRLPLAALAGAAPKPAEAFDYLVRAVRFDPSLTEAYPHLLDEIAARRRGGDIDLDSELEIYLFAESAGFEHPEISLRFGEIYRRLELDEKAVEAFRSLLEGTVENTSIRRRARRYLAEIHLERGDAQAALQLYRPTAGGGAGEFENYYLSARFLLEQKDPKDLPLAREYLEEARKLQPDFHGTLVQLAALDLLEGKPQHAINRLIRILAQGENDPEFLLALGLSYLQGGKFADAEKRIDAAHSLASSSASSELRSQIHLARGLLRDYRGELEPAVAEYRQAYEAGPIDPSSYSRVAASLLLARGLVRTGAAESARPILESLVRARPDDAGIFAAYARLLADVELAAGRPGAAARLIEHAIGFQPEDAFLQWKRGTLLLAEGKLETAYPLLARAAELDPSRPEVHGSLGYYHYTRGDMVAAEASFRDVLRRTPKNPGKELGPELQARLAEVRRYAESGLERVTDVRRLEVWSDTFDRGDGGDIHRGWSKVDNHGVRIAIDSGRIRFAGTQKNRPDGVTKLYREEQQRNIERISARFSFGPEAAGTVQAGLRIDTEVEEIGAGILFFRAPDGALKISVRTTRTGWKELQPTTDTDPAKGRLVYPGTVTWPDGTDFHTLSIRNVPPNQGRKGFDLYLDDRPVAYNVQVSGLISTRGKTLLVGVSGQATNVGVTYEFQVDDFRIYRIKATEDRGGRS